MSRLDSFIRRLQAQRACLDEAARLVKDLPGHVLELGLGNGRTYDHLRVICPGRAIYVFDRQVAAHPDCIPPRDHLFLGDFAETLPEALTRLGRTAALVHVDCGSGDEAASRALAQSLAPSLLALIEPEGVLLSDQRIENIGFADLPLPATVEPGRYHMYRRL